MPVEEFPCVSVQQNESREAFMILTNFVFFTQLGLTDKTMRPQLTSQHFAGSISMGSCKRDITLVPIQRSYVFLVVTHRFLNRSSAVFASWKWELKGTRDLVGLRIFTPLGQDVDTIWIQFLETFPSNVHASLFVGVRLATHLISWHWFRQWLGAAQITGN